MATIKVKLRRSTIEGKAGTVYYRITHRRETKQITTSIRLLPEEWNAEAGRVIDRDENTSIAREKIDRDLSLLKRIIEDLDDSLKSYSVQDISDKYNAGDNRVCILAFIGERIEQLKECNRLGTARNYERAMNSLSQYMRGEDLPLAALTDKFIEGYNAYLVRRGIVRNSISFYMRILRAVYNRAARQRPIERFSPFKNVYTGIDRTRKRAIDEKIISRLYRLDLQKSASLSFTRDLFIFSYCTRGMAFVDMAYLRKTDIRNGTICYARHKTKQRLSIRIEPCIKRIIDRYDDSASVYVFPILKTEDTGKAYSQYQIALNYYNRQLKRLSRMLHLAHGLSSYTARHSWATTARNRNVPITVISAGMGHTSERTTQIYLSLLENSVIDEVNQKIISELE